MEEEKRTFIVLVDPQSRPFPFPSCLGWYCSLLPASSSTLIYVYETLLHGFSVPLTPSQASRMEKSRGILTVQPDAILHPHTTRSPSFLGLDPPASRLSALSRGGSGAVIGIVDTGIWPEHPSFSDSDLALGPAPRRWRGECEEGPGFNRSNCNRKLIGARSFSAGYEAAFGGVEFRSPRDSDGHGTHVASIAAGVPVAGAEFQGFASGVARGMAPRARIAAYKVCWASGCLVSDVVSALEKAVSDGVGVVSLSIGSSSPAPFYYLDPLAVATFRASLRGVFIAASAGNGGPYPGSIANAPPWITTVGAGTIDRDFPAFVQLGKLERVHGTSISAQKRKLPPYPRQLISLGKITAPLQVSLKSRRINGQIVFWEPDRHVSRIDIAAALKQAGAAGTVVFHGDIDAEGILAEPHVIPTVTVGSSAAQSIEEYIKSRENPTAAISSEGTGLLPRGTAPLVASFSSRGPNAALPWVLKPDLVAPGVNILGSWTDAIGPSGIASDIRRSGFSVMSGTSMACPHVSGVAALLRAARPGWGPWQIRSALMTTAEISPVGDESRPGQNAGPFAMGAGHLSPERALDPGLVYDLEYEDYVGFLCGLNYTDEEIRAMSGGGGPRCKHLDGKGVWGFNYPGLVVEEETAVGKSKVEFYRRLKKVDGGCANGCWYSADVVAPEGYKAEVEPDKLWFSGRVGERLGFRLTLRWMGVDETSWEEQQKVNKHWWVGGVITWRERGGRNRVESPIVVFSSNAMQ